MSVGHANVRSIHIARTRVFIYDIGTEGQRSPTLKLKVGADLERAVDDSDISIKFAFDYLSKILTELPR